MRVAALFAACALAGCAAAASPSAGAPASIDVARIAAHHPFAPILARYDDDIATLRAAANAPAFAGMHRNLNDNADAIAGEIAKARARIAAIPQQAPPGVRTAPTASPVDANAAVRRFAQALQTRAARAHAYGEQQAREKEATVALDYDRSHLRARLRLELRLRDNLYLQRRERATLRAQLAALDAQRAAVVERAHQANERVIAASDAKLRAAFAAQLGSLERDLAERAGAMRAIGAPNVASVPRGFALPGSRTAQTSAAFAGTAADLHGRFAELSGIHDAARASATDEIRALVAERDAMREHIVESIRAQADRIARERGLGTVYERAAPRGAVDLTDAVETSIEQGTLTPARK